MTDNLQKSDISDYLTVQECSDFDFSGEDFTIDVFTFKYQLTPLQQCRWALWMANQKTITFMDIITP